MDSSPPPGTLPGSQPGDEDTQEYLGPIGRVDERLPHPECDTCFTVPGLGEGRYQIFEKVETGGEAEILIPRRIPNPAPLRENEIRERYDEETGRDIWYIGTQAFIGPTDEEYWADEAPLPTIELQRIQMDYMEDILSIPGVHGFGIGPAGFVVDLLPEQALNVEQIPLTLENVPVEINISEMITMRNHIYQRFRPIPAGAGIAVRIPNPNGGFKIGGGTLGPHVVRDQPHVGNCCQIWSLTAAHVVQYSVFDETPPPANRLVYQPYKDPPDPADFLGSVSYAFQLEPCRVPVEFCRAYAPINWTHINPDIAAIDLGFMSYPFNTPVGTNPTRRLQKSATATDYINGPSGKIVEAWYGHRHKVWGALSQYQTVYVVGLNQCRIVQNYNTEIYYKVCGLNEVGLGVSSGDSGALIAYEGTGDRHVAGVVVAGEFLTAVYIPANDIKTAFANAGKPFSHFWGTKSDYKRPSSSTCDFPGC